MALRWRGISSRSTVHKPGWLSLLPVPRPKFPVQGPQDLFIGSVVTNAFSCVRIKTWFMAVLLAVVSLVQRAVSVARRVKRSSLARPGAVHLVGLGGSC